MTADSRDTRVFWDRMYGMFSRNELTPASHHLVTEAEPLEPGTALDLGCSEGIDALWLARCGWQVTGVDVSAVAIERAQERAGRLGLADRARFERRDLATEFPDGRFDLVCALFLHSPIGGPKERGHILRRAADAVAPGGHLLIVSHRSMPPWHQGLPDGLTERPLDLTVPTPEENLAVLRLAPAEWDTVRAETVALDVVSPTGETGVREDHILHFRRHH